MITRQKAEQALAEANGNKTEASRLLGVPRSTFRYALRSNPDLEFPEVPDDDLPTEELIELFYHTMNPADVTSSAPINN